MDAALTTAIACATARLRKEFPRVADCHVVIDGIRNGAPRFSARIDLRLPESQLLICGAPAGSVEGALDAAIAQARERLLRSPSRAA